jgi:hypothetical protein
MDENFQIIVTPPAEEVAARYDEIGERAVHLQPGLEDVARLFEAEEARHFGLMRGRYVLTGATMRSLTEAHASGAIRQVFSDHLHFGTHVPQAHYLTKSPHDAENFQVEKHNGKGRSAVLVLRPHAQEQAAKILADYVAEPFQ